jgi:hypothetical protein
MSTDVKLDLADEAIVTQGGLKVKFNAGGVAVTVNGKTVTVDRTGKVALDAANDAAPATNDAAPAKSAPQIGDTMEDGTMFAGISPDTNKPMFAAAADAPGVYDHNEAEKYANGFEGHGHKDFRVPTKGELNALFNNRAAIGGFNVTGSNPAGWYWSSSRSYYGNAWAQRFSDGNQNNNNRNNNSSLRLVR